MAAKFRIFANRNFAVNLNGIETFLSKDRPQKFQILLTRLFDDICPVISQFPLSGRSFFVHREGSKDAQLPVSRLKKKLQVDDDLREFAFDDYV